MGNIHAGKDVENRTWTTRFRGTIAIHASGNLDRNAEMLRWVALPEPDDLIRGAIIDLVEIVHVVEDHRSKWSWVATSKSAT